MSQHHRMTSTLIRSSLLLSLAGTVGMGAIACSSQPQVNVPNPSQPESVMNALVGTWQMEDKATGSIAGKPKWIFTEDGQLIYTDLPNRQSNFVGTYKINPATSPMQMELQIGLTGQEPSEVPHSKTIFEFTPEGKLKVRTSALRSDNYPNDFTGGDTVLQKISDSARVP